MREEADAYLDHDRPAGQTADKEEWEEGECSAAASLEFATP